ncbi:ROK family glucokinase [Paenibacillus pasadenensis]|uniref:Glucokinase n=1 Tax=Paenibacillus pasadenensis TaxID=217090 RepID=A0A2N5N0B8_9BACL|nr:MULTISPECIES: ROK family glucokinase [Paenibacillus]PLT43776.1 Glucokinase [Paenibacillus pasadenensis]QGG54390.1 ROK family glucokinase [Paenibacillus sp. B01]
MSETIYVGADIGGTAIKVGVCSAAGELLQTYEGPTEASHGADRIVDNIVKYVRHIVDATGHSWEQVGGVGVGIAGFLDIPNGIVKFSNNLNIRNVPLKQMLEDQLGVIVKVNNDANVAALGEAWGGAGRGVPNCVCYTLGTGVGGGVIIGGRIYEGYNGMAGELGHMSIVPDLEAIQCTCGMTGCLETVSSATGIIRMAKDAVARGDKTSLSLVPNLMAKEVIDAAKEGDEVAARIVNRAAYYLGRSMAATAVTLNPQRFIVGGGVAKAGDFLFDQIREVFAKYTQPEAKEGVEIVAATLGNNAGVVGAAGLILRS